MDCGIGLIPFITSLSLRTVITDVFVVTVWLIIDIFGVKFPGAVNHTVNAVLPVLVVLEELLLAKLLPEMFTFAGNI